MSKRTEPRLCPESRLIRRWAYLGPVLEPEVDLLVSGAGAGGFETPLEVGGAGVILPAGRAKESLGEPSALLGESSGALPALGVSSTGLLDTEVVVVAAPGVGSARTGSGAFTTLSPALVCASSSHLSQVTEASWLKILNRDLVSVL